MISRNQAQQNVFETVPANEAEDLMRMLSRAVPVSRIPGYVGCSRTHAQALVKNGPLYSVVQDNGKDSGRHKGVDSRALDRMMENVYAQGKEVTKASFGMANIAETSAALKVPFVIIIQAIIGGKLREVETQFDTNSLFSVFVNLQEVTQVLRLQTGAAGVSISDAARELKLTTHAVKHILSARDDEGQPYLKTCGQFRHMGTMRDLIEPVTLDDFKSKFKKLSDVCGRMPTKIRKLREDLASRVSIQNGNLVSCVPSTLGLAICRLTSPILKSRSSERLFLFCSNFSWAFYAWYLGVIAADKIRYSIFTGFCLSKFGLIMAVPSFLGTVRSEPRFRLLRRHCRSVENPQTL